MTRSTASAETSPSALRISASGLMSSDTSAALMRDPCRSMSLRRPFKLGAPVEGSKSAGSGSDEGAATGAASGSTVTWGENAGSVEGAAGTVIDGVGRSRGGLRGGLHRARGGQVWLLETRGDHGRRSGRPTLGFADQECL